MQRQEDLHFHEYWPPPIQVLLRFMCQVINRLLRHSVAMNRQPATGVLPEARRHRRGRAHSASSRRRGAAT